MSALQFLLLEANLPNAEVVQATLMEGGINCELLRVETRADFIRTLETDEIDLILADYALSSFDGIAALTIARRLRPDTPFIFISASLGEELAIAAIQQGATDYVLKQRLGRLVPSVERALRKVPELDKNTIKRKQAEVAVELELKDMRLLHELSARLLTEGDIQTLYQEIMAAAIALTRADAGTVQILDEATQELVLLATQGFERNMTEYFYRVNADSNTPCGMALKNSDRTFIDFDVPKSEDLDGSMQRHVEAGYLSAQSTPLITRSGKPIGMVSTHWREHHRPSDHQLRFLDLLARQAADLIEQRQAQAALRESEEKYRSLFNSIDEGFYLAEVIWDDAGKAVDISYLDENLVAMQIVGQSLKGRLMSEIDPNYEQYWRDTFGYTAKTGEAQRLEQYAKPNDMWFGFYVFKPEGVTDDRTIAVIFQNITDRKRREANFAFLASIANDLSRLSSADEIMQTIGAKLCEYLKLATVNFLDVDESRDELAVCYFWTRTDALSLLGTYRTKDYLNEEFVRVSRAGEMTIVGDTQTDWRTDARSYAALEVGSFVSIPFHRNGEWKFLLALSDPQPRDWRDDETELLQEFSNRIFPRLERARAEDALRESEAKYRSLFESINDGFCIVEMIFDENEKPIDYRFMQISPSFERQTGLVNAQGLRMRELAPDHEEYWFEIYGNVALTGQSTRFENRAEHLDRWFDIYAFPVGEPEKRQVAIVFNDISDHKQAEENRIRLIREQAAREEERQKAEALAELDRAKTVFFSNVSHEFRTPLTLILSPLEEALSSLSEQNQTGNGRMDGTRLHSPVHLKTQLQLAHRNGLRLLKLVNTLLDFSRIEADRTQANYEPTDLSTYTAELASVFRSAIENTNLQLVVDCPPLPSPIYIDREMWEKIVLNLLSNALKFTFEGIISVSLKPKANTVELIVSDTGIGIAASELPHLFERFYQVKGGKGRSYEGSGIGLSLVQELVKQHGGVIALTSVVDEGTTFTVSIPTGIAHLPAEQIGVASILVSTAVTANAFVEEAWGWLPEQEEGGRGQGELPLTKAQNFKLKARRFTLKAQNFKLKARRFKFQTSRGRVFS
ncbi:GAF domain-containing protein [Nostoc sp. UCD121]|uniref:hybrid sensor histidine kinase/response regulator n=1 Tax=unclassified Nostoc TaxID=2593658 RepID=UPI00162AA5EE|nr:MULTISPECIES: ATP-binding protein [unclassified Nostoc]MBC1221108.1 GAF domain-containing protein [Nostoc sp. UCD120]MBC1278623.1 GAF domain-containing protein [Nostoc sp. UCD121]MBC1296857.1 GAF domain-containing protein [Nostoc sp. UCD122]